MKNAAFCVHSLAFSDCKIRGFPFVFLTVNSSFRSIIRQFSTTVNSSKTGRYTGVHRVVNALKTHCFPLFSRRFQVTKQRVNWCLRKFLSLTVNARHTGCFPMFSGASQLQNNAFAGVFSDFSWIFSNRECVQNDRKPPVLQRSPVG